MTYLPSRSYPQGAFGSEFLGLLGEISPPSSAATRYRRRRRARSSARRVSRPPTTVLNPGFVRARLRVDSLGRIAGPLRARHGGAADAPADDRRPAPARGRSKAMERRARARARNGHATPTGGGAVVMNPWHRRDLRARELPDLQPGRGGQEPAATSRASTPIAQDLAPQPGDAGRLPDRLDVQADRRRGGALAGTDHAVDPAALQRLVQPRRHVFHNVEAGISREHALPTALAQSCDTWFYRLGDSIYASIRASRAPPSSSGRSARPGHATGLDVPGDAAGLVPTPAWLEKNQHFAVVRGPDDQPRDRPGLPPGDPLQLAVEYSALANGGTVVRPHVGEAVLRGSSVQKLRSSRCAT